MNEAIVPVILCGGSGTRLWPASREKLPKQFLRLAGENSLLQDTFLRTRRICNALPDRFMTVTLASLGAKVREQLAESDPAAAGHVLNEPCARNTAAAVALAALYAKTAFGEDAILWVLPADHFMGDEQALETAFHLALKAAQSGRLVTFGIQPTRPETGYGYIRKAATDICEGIYSVERFVEKPDLETAKSYLSEGTYLWNSGMFVFRVRDVLDAFGTHSPAILEGVERALRAGTKGNPDPALYEAINSEPFDKAIMEKSDKVAVVPCDPQWSDIGSWESLWELRDKDENGNVTDGSVVCHRTENCLISASGRLIACAGVENLVIIDTGDAILIAAKSDGSAIKGIVDQLKKSQSPLTVEPPDRL